MNTTVLPGELSGKIDIPSSKSQAHRLLICAALSAAPVSLSLRGLSQDILATCDCLRALGADIREQDGGLLVTPIRDVPKTEVLLPCRESGSTLRFLLPVCGMLGVSATFCCEGRLAQRPLSPLDEELCAHGMQITQNGNQILCQGKLTAGDYTLAGNVSSQFFTGLLLALPHLQGESTLCVTGKLESAPYIAMTGRALELCGVQIMPVKNGWRIAGGQTLHLPSFLTVEGDWSNAAMFLCGGALSEHGVKVRGIRTDSVQGDRAVCTLLQRFGANVNARDFTVTVSKGTLHGIEIDASQIPDLIPVLSVVAACAEGETRIYNAARLRLKESDRI
ncbi:MAG: 3-phosphoshikimate 1-carboxyvinyltransferase, partial [Oscillospiraceae bacterium]|nr:3-phosphoshikimate 1-carboxyvinyltransferase [Oscillospiraceae bacterium]